MEKNKILFILTGSISLYKMAYVLSHFMKLNFEIKVVMTESAKKFINISTIEGLTHQKVYTELYENGHNMDHIHLVRWADLIVVAPATANYINKIACGIADDLATTLSIAHNFKTPFIIFPAMNTAMYQHPVTQSHFEKLLNFGYNVIPAESGTLACKEVGPGRLPDPEIIIEKIESFLKKSKINIEKQNSTKYQNPIRILITSGGTVEPIDDVRCITNRSTGRTASLIADQLIDSGFEVTYLHSQTAKLTWLPASKYISFTSFKDLESKLYYESKNHDVIIHAAAVSDYSVQSFNGKIDSDAETMQITLNKNPKLINEIKKLNPNTFLIGFKLTSTTDDSIIQKKINQLFDNSNCDWVVQNDWKTRNNNQDLFRLYNNNEQFKIVDLHELTLQIINQIQNIVKLKKGEK